MRVFLYLLIWCLLSACTSGAIDNRNADDPFENFNRKSYRFSESVDGNFLAPVARGYARVTPDPIEKGISNVFKNFNNAPSAINGFLQGDVETGFNELSRLIVNSTLGLGGLFDVATIWGVNEKKEDIGHPKKAPDQRHSRNAWKRCQIKASQSCGPQEPASGFRGSNRSARGPPKK